MQTERSLPGIETTAFKADAEGDATTSRMRRRQKRLLRCVGTERRE
jgi:hypothetical protein